MTVSNNRLSSMADALVFAFPILILCVPRGAGVFLAGVGVLLLLGWRGMGRAWREHAAVLRPLTLSVLLFLGVYVTSKFLHDTPWNVIDNPSRALLAVLTCWVIARVAPNPERLWQGVTVGLFLALLIVGWQKFALDVPRPSAFVQAIAFANMVAALALVGFARPSHSRASNTLAWINIVCAILIQMLNGTRGSLVAMLVTLLPMLLVRYQRFNMRMFVVAALAIATLAAGACMVPGSPLGKRVDEVVSEIKQFDQGNPESSVGARLMMWGVGMQYFASHPWTGIGVGQFARILQATPYCEQRSDTAQGGQSIVCVLEHAHNDIVEAAATTGLPGLFSLLGLFLVPAALFLRALRKSRATGDVQVIHLAGAGLGVVMASMISGLTQVTTAHQANIVFYAGLIGLLLGLAGREARVTEGHNMHAAGDSKPRAA